MLIIQDVSVELSKHEILKKMNLCFKKGNLYGIIGPNGAGKSTLLSTIANITSISKGKILINNKDINEYSTLELAKHISLMSQNFTLKFPYTVEQIVAMGRYPYGKGYLNKEDMKKIKLSIEESELEKLQCRKVTKLSGGEKQRVLFAKTLCQDTDIILIDEGFSNADIYYQAKFIKLLKQKVKQENKLIILIIHDLSMARKYCDEILILKNGTVYDFGKSEEVLNDESLFKVFNVKGKFKGNALEIV
ncbi:ABC transporter ATP-binding protein [Haloimpatiens sp. FM7330]|uniref:ABC transporter ATP-binding protein n=1 Tax=Haloimpatiens sp. FM7330 TaxID=3298610 RepID=UPI0036399CF3